MAVARRQESRYGPRQGGLSAPRFSDDGDGLATSDLNTDILQDVDLSVIGGGDLLDGEYRVLGHAGEHLGIDVLGAR